MSLSKLELRAKVIDIIDRLNIDISDTASNGVDKRAEKSWKS